MSLAVYGCRGISPFLIVMQCWPASRKARPGWRIIRPAWIVRARWAACAGWEWSGTAAWTEWWSVWGGSQNCGQGSVPRRPTAVAWDQRHGSGRYFQRSLFLVRGSAVSGFSTHDQRAADEPYAGGAAGCAGADGIANFGDTDGGAPR